MKTSITKDQLRRFLKTAQVKEQLGCENIPGFHVLQMAKNPVWRLRYTDLLGKRRTVKIGNAKVMSPVEAAEIASDWRLGMVKGEADPVAKRDQQRLEAEAEAQQLAARGNIKLGSYIEVYERELIKHSGEREARATINQIKNNFGHLFNRDMDMLTKNDIREWEALRKKEGIKRESLFHYFGALKAMLNFAAGLKRGHENDNPIIEFNPLRDVQLLRKTAEEKRQDEDHKEAMNLKRDLLSDDEREKLQNGLELFAEKIRAERRKSRKHGKKHLPDLDDVTYPHWFIPFCHVARLTGMRPGDILSLRWQHLQTHLRSHTQILSFTPNKTRHHDNPIQINFPVAGELAEVLKKWSEQRGNPTSGYIFTSDRGNGGTKLNRHSYKNHWDKLKELAEVRKEIQFYSFRHNFISDLVSKGRPILTIAALVGHKDGTMIAANYMRHDMGDLAEIVEQFGAEWIAPKESSPDGQIIGAVKQG